MREIISRAPRQPELLVELRKLIREGKCEPLTESQDILVIVLVELAAGMNLHGLLGAGSRKLCS
jgi:hypothetical protein